MLTRAIAPSSKRWACHRCTEKAISLDGRSSVSNLGNTDLAAVLLDLRNIVLKRRQSTQVAERGVNAKERPAAEPCAHRSIHPCKCLVVLAQYGVDARHLVK